MRILVIDDDRLILKTLEKKLTDEGHTVSRAENSITALQYLEHQAIDLVISDIMMPNMSGLDLLSLLKKFYYSRTPIIIMSSLKNAELVESSLGLGAYCFLSKPIDMEELMIAIEKSKELAVPDTLL